MPIERINLPNPLLVCNIYTIMSFKVHGGTTHEDIAKKVREAEKIACKNHTMNPKMHTVLFFDEANTTEAIGVIKEIMCDKTLSGQRIDSAHGLQLIAACNPYRKFVYLF